MPKGPLYQANVPEVQEGGWINHKNKTVDWDSWSESGGTMGIFGQMGYRPADDEG